MDWINKISILCFVASYVVVFLLEVTRVFFQASFRKYIRIGFTIAGLFAHSAYLVCHGQLELGPQGIWLDNWFGWCLAAAWFLAAAYLWISIRQNESVLGLFLIPVVMILIWLGIQFGSKDPFSVSSARSVWSTVHGLSLLLGTVLVALGFVFGLVYLMQASRLKHKTIQNSLFRLPSLEWLQQCGEYSLICSAILMGVGMISGIALNRLGADNEGSLPLSIWSDPVIWSTAILFGWMSIAAIFSRVYRPARQGRKVAYLVLTSFLFLVLELSIVWYAGHGHPDPVSVDSPLAEVEVIS